MGSDLQSRLSSGWTFGEIQQRIDFELFHLVSKIGKREVGSRLWSAEGEWWKTVPEKSQESHDFTWTHGLCGS